MGTPYILSGLFAVFLASYTASAVGLTPGSVHLDLVFPLNDSYAPLDGRLPIVISLSSQPFQPLLVSTLQLHLSYLVNDVHNYSQPLASGDFDLGKLSSNSADNPYLLIAYSDKLAGHTSQFELQCIVSSVVGFPNATGDHNQSTLVTNPNLIYQTYFTTENGAQAATIPSSATNGTTCLPHGGWSMEFGVRDYIEIKSDTYAVLAPHSPTISSVPCAVEVDAATAASIAAGITAAATTTTATSSASGAAASSAGTVSCSGFIVLFWGLVVLVSLVVLSQG